MCVCAYEPDIVLVSLMAPVLRAGIAKQAVRSSTPSLIRALNAALAKLPSSCFERSPKGISYTLNQRIACYFVKVTQSARLVSLPCIRFSRAYSRAWIDFLNSYSRIILPLPSLCAYTPPTGTAIFSRWPRMWVCRPRNCQLLD